MATLYITSTANTGTGTLRTLISSAAAGDVIQPSPTTFPKSTVCSVSLTSSLSITKNLTIQGGQTRLVITSTSYIAHGSSSTKPSYVNYTDVDFRGLTATSSGAIRCQYCANHTFLRCSFCGMSGYTAPVVVNNTALESVKFQDCAFYGNRATQNSSGAAGAVYITSNTASKTSFINCTLGANYRNYSSSQRHNYGGSPSVTNIVNTAAQEAEWKTPPASTYGYDTWTATSYQSMNPRPSATASWRTGATSTSSTVDLDGNARRSNGALGAYEYYIGKLATPTGLAATSVTASSITLSWNSVTNATWYRVVVTSADTSTTSTVSGTSTTITGLSSNTTYLCTVIATADYYLDSDGASCSATTSATGTRLAAPTIASHSDSASGTTLIWYGEDGDADGYRIELYDNDVLVGSTTITGWTSTTGTIGYSGFTYGQEYTIKLYAVGSGSYIDSYPAVLTYTFSYETPVATQLAAPTMNAFVRPSSDSLALSYLQARLAAVVEHADTYEYQIATNSTFTTGLLTRTSSTVTSGYPLSGYFTGLTSGQLYYARARALSSDSAYSTSEWSNVRSTHVSSYLETPVVTVSNISQTSATLSWGAVANRTSYTVRWRAQGESTWNQSTGLTATSKALSGLTLGTTYEYEVIAVGPTDREYLNSAAATGTFTTVALITLDTPTNLASSNITNNSATVSWTGDDRATQFKVEYRASDASTWEEKLVTA